MTLIITRAMLLDAVETSLKKGIEHLADVYLAGAEDGEHADLLASRFRQGLKDEITAHEAMAAEVEDYFAGRTAS